MVVPVIPKQREFRSNASKPFNDLIKYLEGVQEQEQQKAVQDAIEQGLTNVFHDVIDYAMDSAAHGDKCIAVRTHGVNSRDTAAIEMNAVSRKNPRCKDPVYHFILSWPEHERPAPAEIFDAAEHAIKALGLSKHQYIVAVHDNTDNRHCHIAVNRVHPVTFKSQNIEWAKRTLHYAAREIELKHGWSHDNGIYVVRTDGHGVKAIVLNPDHAKSFGDHPSKSQGGPTKDALLPAWHDPESLESWLKGSVAKALKLDLPELTSWHALHVWLSARQIRLTDTGGGGLRLQATSAETGEILDVPASRGLRLIKRAELEKRWGPFTGLTPISVFTADTSQLSTRQLIEGANHVIQNTLDRGIPPPDHILRAEELAQGTMAGKSGGMHDLSDGGMAGEWGGVDLPLSGSLSPSLGDIQAGEDRRLRRPGNAPSPGRERPTGLSGESNGAQLDIASDSRLDERRSSSSRASRDELREARRLEREAQRRDLRQRFNQYRRLARSGDADYFLKTKELRDARRDANRAIRVAAKAAKASLPASFDRETRLLSLLQIEAEALKRRTEQEAQYQNAFSQLRAQRKHPIGWRTWLTKQAELGDQAALSALRGIVYQARRDAKRTTPEALDVAPDTPDYREKQFQAIMASLLEDERKDLAIRSSSVRSMRPHDADALLIRHVGTRWQVTGNGNIEYCDLEGSHLYTDRGNRITFDRVHVTDDEIRLALLHAQCKFGNQLTLTGPDRDFTRRMAFIADQMGMTILNPDLQEAIQHHRHVMASEATVAATASQGTVHDATPLPSTPSEQDISTRLQALVLAIDPEATFVEKAHGTEGHFVGPVVSVVKTESGTAFAQHTGRGVYLVHNFELPESLHEQVLEITYTKAGVDTRAIQKDLGQSRR